SKRGGVSSPCTAFRNEMGILRMGENCQMRTAALLYKLYWLCGGKSRKAARRGGRTGARRLDFPPGNRYTGATVDRREGTGMAPRREKKRNLFANAALILRRKRTVATIYVLLRFFVILVMVAQFFNRNYENVFLCALTLILF